MELARHSRQRLVAVHPLDQMEDYRIREVLSLMNVCLTNLIVGLIVQVFRGESGGINGRKARTIFFHQMALN